MKDKVFTLEETSSSFVTRSKRFKRLHMETREWEQLNGQVPSQSGNPARQLTLDDLSRASVVIE